MELEKIEKGTKISYPFFKNIFFEGTDERHVIMKDKQGNEKKVFKELFLKYGRIEK